MGPVIYAVKRDPGLMKNYLEYRARHGKQYAEKEPRAAATYE